MPSLINVTCANGYTDAATIRQAEISRVVIQTFNNPVLYQIAYDKNGWNFDQFEHVLYPSLATLASPFIVKKGSAIRFRNFVAGSNAVVNCDVY